MSERVSAFIITRNEAHRLGRTLEALAWADEVIVVDSGSTDGTQDIARDAGAAVHHHPFEGYGQQKSFAENQCRNDWVLNVDADEVVTTDLANEITSTVGGSPAAYRVRILNVYPGDEKPRRWANDYNVVRLYHRSVARYRAHALYDRVECSVEPGQLKAPIHHFPLVSLAHFVDKENRYSSYAADTGRRRSRTALLIRLPFEMPIAFLKFYFARRHATGGWKGFIFALTASFARTLRLAKMLEREETLRKEKTQRPENCC